MFRKTFFVCYMKVDWDVFRWRYGCVSFLWDPSICLYLVESWLENYFDTFFDVPNLLCFSFSFRSGVSHMDAVIRRCPFLTVVPSVCLQLAGKSSLLSYAQRCPVMMDLASRAPARALSSSASAFKDRPPNDGQLSSIFLKQKSVFFFFFHTILI